MLGQKKIGNSYYLAKYGFDDQSLSSLYLSEKMSIREIARYFDCSYGTIYSALCFYNIPLRKSCTGQRHLSEKTKRKISYSLRCKGSKTRECHQIDCDLSTLTHDELSYLAGFFDGEGHIGIGIHKAKTGIRRYPSFSVFTNIANTNEAVIKEFYSKIGGSFSIILPRKKKYKILYRLQFCGENTKKFLESVYPYLRVKKPQASLALEFFKAKDNMNHPIYGYKRIDHLKLDKLYLRMRELND